MRKVIEIVEIVSGRVEKEFDVTGKSEREVEKIERGILRNLGDDYYVNTADRANAPKAA